MIMRLSRKQYKRYKGNVYDIGVETSDHSYMINNVVVHNSAGGSMIAYLLGITKVNPLDYDLLFERFMNEGRIGELKKEKRIVINDEINFAFDEQITILREENRLTIKAGEIQKGDKII
jgi:hypothetical protein